MQSIGKQNEAVQAIITKSSEELDTLMKRNEELHTQVAMENSKRDVRLRDAQGMSEELNELFHPPPPWQSKSPL